MFRITFLVLLFIKLSLSSVYGEDAYKIVFKIDKNIITNYDVQKETNYLLALNPALESLSKKQMKKFATNSIIKEIIKKNEVSKFYIINYDNPSLTSLLQNFYSRLNINTESEFKNYLSKFNLSVDDITKKLAIETTWNKLIYNKFKNFLNIDEKKIRDDLKNDFNKTKSQTKYLISEILFDPKNENELDTIYKNIVATVNEKDFKTAATIYSISDTAINGGEIGWVNKSALSNTIYDKLKNLKINEFSKPIKITSGFLILYLNDLKKEDTKINQEEELQKIIVTEKNRQLNQYSLTYYKKIETQSFINEK